MSTEEEIIEELDFRKEEDHDNRFQPRVRLTVKGPYSIVSRNGWMGVMSGNDVIIPSIYDDIELRTSGRHVFVVCDVFGKKGVWLVDSNRGLSVIPVNYHEILSTPHHDGIIFIGKEGEGLYCLERRKILFEAKYNKVSFNTSSRSIWAQTKDDSYIFINGILGNQTMVHRRIIPIELEDFTGYIEEDGHIEFIEGDSYQFRKLVVSEGGRLRLTNSRSGKLYISDPNGYILNL